MTTAPTGTRRRRPWRERPSRAVGLAGIALAAFSLPALTELGPAALLELFAAWTAAIAGLFVLNRVGAARPRQAEEGQR